MKKLLVLFGVLFLMGSVSFAQSETTGKSVKKSSKVNDSMSFNEAFVTARQDVGAGGIFEWRGKQYCTYYKEEMDALSPNDQKEFLENANKNTSINKKDELKPEKEVVEEKVIVEEIEAEEILEKTVEESKVVEQKPEKHVADDPVVKPTPVENQNGAEITFKETNHDFGTIPFKGNGSYEFEFVNSGNEPLILSQPKSSCGCTVPEWPKEPILPGQTNVIKVTYKNTDRPGNFNKYVTVFSNALNNKEVKLHIKGTVEAQPTDAAPLKMESIGSPVNKNN